MDIAARVEQVIAHAIEAEGMELVHVEYQPRGAASILRIFIDKPGGVTLQDCQRISRHVGVLLDVEDLIPSQYTLEVSSPGIERPLFKEADYERYLGREVRLVTLEKIEGRKNFVGLIRNYSGGVLQLESEGRMYSIPFSKIKKANLVYHF